METLRPFEWEKNVHENRSRCFNCSEHSVQFMSIKKIRNINFFIVNFTILGLKKIDFGLNATQIIGLDRSSDLDAIMKKNSKNLLPSHPILYMESRFVYGAANFVSKSKTARGFSNTKILSIVKKIGFI